MRRILVLVFLAGALVQFSAASSYVMVNDADLAEASSSIVVGQVLQARGVMREGIPWTRYTMVVEDTLHGQTSTRLQFEVPGGVAEGLGLRLYGMPSFSRGEKVLLFLSPGQGEVRQLTHQMLGAFSVYKLGDREVALRHLDGAREVALPQVGERGRYHRPRDLQAFARWLKARGTSEADYFTQLTAADREEVTRQRSLRPRFTLLTCDAPDCAQPSALRWMNFETTQAVWFINDQGQDGLPEEGENPAGTQGLQDAIDAWVDDPGSTINYAFGGESGVTNIELGSGFSDSILLFNDQRNRISNDFSCDEGGVLANGGPFFALMPLFPHKGVQVRRITRGFVNMNAGIECVF
ncbi:MAG TPA: hypothetical protein VLV83_01885, partial [Acidobacteriota bacterium]|nr:hypothetical protein [Acidobacteriota bacterium]